MIVQALTTASNAAKLTSLVFTIFFGIDLLSKHFKMRQGSQETGSIVEMPHKWREMERNAEKGGRTAGDMAEAVSAVETGALAHWTNQNHFETPGHANKASMVPT
jgi:hypothetical protein